MSADAPAPDAPTRSIRAYRRRETNPQMSVVGYLIAAPLVVLLLPLLPFIVLYWLYDRLRSQ